jgi:hypothetical protein
MDELKEKGLIYAREHWPKDKPGSLELLHFKDSPYRKQTGRKRQYIGKRKGRIDAALKGIERQKELPNRRAPKGVFYLGIPENYVNRFVIDCMETRSIKTNTRLPILIAAGKSC